MSEAKFVLITGAAKRVGRAIALYLANAGYDIAIHYGHSKEEAHTLQREIDALGRQTLLLQADLSDSSAVSTMIPTLLTRGSLVALINNAAVFEIGDHTTSLAVWNKHLAVNVTAPFILSKSFAEHCKAGRIINLLDWRTARSNATHLSYAVSKEALAALTRNLAVSLAPHFQVNGLALGAILPPSDGRVDTQLLSSVPLGRWATLTEVGEAIQFLLEGPTYINAEVLTIDGGRSVV